MYPQEPKNENVKNRFYQSLSALCFTVAPRGAVARPHPHSNGADFNQA